MTCARCQEPKTELGTCGLCADCAHVYCEDGDCACFADDVRRIDPAQAAFWDALGGHALTAGDVEPFGIEYITEPERLREVERRYPCPTVLDAGHGIFGCAVGLVYVDDDTGRAVAYAPPVTALRDALRRQAEVLRTLGDAFRQIALIGDDPRVDDATARKSIALLAGEALQTLDGPRPYPAKPPAASRPTGFHTERRQHGLCPVCGERIELIGNTTDGRYIGSCQDAFWPRQWRQLGPRLPRPTTGSKTEEQDHENQAAPRR